jgi:riboflavin biosynthesis pyrimidine reductase
MNEYRATQRRNPRARKVLARSGIWKGLLLTVTTCITLFSSPSFAWHGGQTLPSRKHAPPKTLLSVLPRDDSSISTDTVTGVTLKIALDANGGAADLAESKSERFTSPESLDMVHRLRCASDAVLVGRGTVFVDDCSLTVRRVPCDRPQPIRVVLDPRLSLLLDEARECKVEKSYTIFQDGLRTVVYHSVPEVDHSSLNLLKSVTCVYLPSSATSTKEEDSLREGGYMSANDVVQDLSERFNVRHLMVEGGPATAKLFLQDEHELVDRVILVRAPLCFRQPLDAGISGMVLEKAGLQLLGLVVADDNVDQIECWSRLGAPWPTEELGDWP